MPALRPLRRSRRLSKQAPLSGWDEWETLNLGAESLFPPIPPTLTPSSSQTPSSYHDSLPSSTVSSPNNAYCPLSSPIASVRHASSHARKRKDGHIPRPPNAFMLFRSHFWNTQVVRDTTESDHRHISRIAGHVWNAMSEEKKAPFKALALEAKQKHALEHPDYKYSPVYIKSKASKRRVKRDGADDQKRCEKMAELVLQGYSGEQLEHHLKGVEATTSRPSPKTPSKPRPRQRPLPNIPSTPVKHESPHTPGLTFDSPELEYPTHGPVQPIPDLDLSFPGFTFHMGPECELYGGLFGEQSYTVSPELCLSPHQIPETGVLWDVESSAQAQTATEYQSYPAWDSMIYQPVNEHLFSNLNPFSEANKLPELPEFERARKELESYFNFEQP